MALMIWGPRHTDYKEGSALLLAKGRKAAIGLHELTQPPIQDNFTLPCRGLMTLSLWLSQRTRALFLKSLAPVNKPFHCYAKLLSSWIIPARQSVLPSHPFVKCSAAAVPVIAEYFTSLGGRGGNSYHFRRFVRNHSQQGHRMASSCMGAITFTGFSVHTPLLGFPPFRAEQ